MHHYAPDVVRAVRLVRAAGGVPVMAHPFANRRGRTVSDEVIEEMAAAGLAGLEINHRDHFGPERAHGQALVERLGLFATGSSDFHGAGKENRLGENTTEPAVLGPDRGAGEQRSDRGAPVSSLLDFEVFVSVFVTLLVIMDPPGALPIFLALTKSLTQKQRVSAARRASLVAFGVIAAFAVFGQQILGYLHISLPALQGAGGLLLLLVALSC